MHKKRTLSVLVLLCCLGILVATACGPSPESAGDPAPSPTTEAAVSAPAVATTEPETEAAGSSAEEAYPPRQPTATTATTDSYPPPSPAPTAITSYPDPTEATGTLLAFAEPVRAGDTAIRGVGPAGLQVTVLNITRGGDAVGAATIGADGTFSVPVTGLEANTRLGLAAAPEQQGVAPDTVRPDEQARAVPTIGFFYDTVLVAE